MTHFCKSGHQSRLRIVPTKDSALVVFESFEQLNVSPKTKAYVKEIKYEFLNADEMKLEITWFDGKTSKVERLSFARLENRGFSSFRCTE